MASLNSWVAVRAAIIIHKEKLCDLKIMCTQCDEQLLDSHRDTSKTGVVTFCGHIFHDQCLKDLSKMTPKGIHAVCNNRHSTCGCTAETMALPYKEDDIPKASIPKALGGVLAPICKGHLIYSKMWKQFKVIEMKMRPQIPEGSSMPPMYCFTDEKHKCIYMGGNFTYASCMCLKNEAKPLTPLNRQTDEKVILDTLRGTWKYEKNQPPLEIHFRMGIFKQHPDCKAHPEEKLTLEMAQPPDKSPSLNMVHTNVSPFLDSFHFDDNPLGQKAHFDQNDDIKTVHFDESSLLKKGPIDEDSVLKKARKLKSGTALSKLDLAEWCIVSQDRKSVV